MCEKLNCMNCCIADFKYVLCDCDNGIYKEYKKIGSAEDFENEVLNRTKPKTGHWEEVPYKTVEHGEVVIRGKTVRCSICKHAEKGWNKGMNYCPNCGSRNVKKDD